MLESPNLPLIIDHPQRGSLAALALWDIDGTVNDETQPEAQRLETIAPAKQALQILQSHNIPSGPITSRSFGEAKIYSTEIGSTGPQICEDGSVIVPPGNTEKVVIVSKIDKQAIAKFVEFVQENFPQEEIVSTIFSTRERLMEACGHATVEDAEKSAERHASAYIVPQNKEQREFIFKHSPSWNLRAFGDVINISGDDANKGKALEMLDQYASTFWGEKFQGVFPIIFGNNTNDIPSLQKAIKLGGMGILVGKPQGGFSVTPEQTPEGTTIVQAPFGHGILESVKIIKDDLQKRFGLILS